MREKLTTAAIVLALLVPAGIAQAQNNPSQNNPSQNNPSQNNPPQNNPPQGDASQNAASPPGSSAAFGRLIQDPTQRHQINEGLKQQQAQSASPGYDGQVGTQVPDAMTPHALPNDVTAQVPQTQGYYYVKLPDRVLLIDPQTKQVVEIVGDESTTGLGPSGNGD